MRYCGRKILTSFSKFGAISDSTSNNEVVAKFFGRYSRHEWNLQRPETSFGSVIPQTELVPRLSSKSISRIIVTELLPEIRPKQVCGRICAYNGPQGVKAISVSHRNARTRANRPLGFKQLANRRAAAARSPFKSF